MNKKESELVASDGEFMQSQGGDRFPLKPCNQIDFPERKRTKTAMDHASHERKEKPEKGIAPAISRYFPEIVEHFDIVKKIGAGTFSKVYLAKLRQNSQCMFALKHLVPTSAPARIEKELKCLLMLGGMHNFLGVKSTLRAGDHVIFILPYFPHAKFVDLIRKMQVDDVRDYMYNLFVALKHVHSYQIIHRDVKPSNFLYSKELARYALIDFGLAMQVPGTRGILSEDAEASTHSGPDIPASTDSKVIPTRDKKHVARSHIMPRCRNPHEFRKICNCCKNRPRQVVPRAGTPGFRSPEVLMKWPHQTTAVDIWSAGVILLCILSGRYPFFKATDDLTALAQLVTLFGSETMAKMADKIGKDFLCLPAVERVGDLKWICEKLRRRCKVHMSAGAVSASVLERADTGNVCNDSSRNDRCESVPTERRTCKRKRTARVQLNSSTCDQSLVTTSMLSLSSPNNSAMNLRCRSRRSADQTSFQEVVERVEKGESQGGADRVALDTACHCVPDSAYELLAACLDLDPATRITAEQALEHEFFSRRKSSSVLNNSILA